MKWRDLGSWLRGRESDGSLRVLWCSMFGAWIVQDGKERRVRISSVRALKRRDLLVVARRDGPDCYGYRSRYS